MARCVAGKKCKERSQLCRNGRDTFPALLRMWRTGTAVIGAMLIIAAAPPRDVALPGERLFPESIAISDAGETFIGSQAGGVLRVPAGGAAEQWLAPGADGTAAIFGVLADSVNGMLWVCSHDMSDIGIGPRGEAKGSLFKGFDLKTRQQKVSLALPSAQSLCNDIAVSEQGAVYITNTASPEILLWQPGAPALERWFEDRTIQGDGSDGLNGIAFGADGNLYVTNYGKGEIYRIAMIDGKAGSLTKLALSRPIERPDGLRLIHGTTFAMTEGAGRLDRVTVTADQAFVEPLVDGLVSPTGVAFSAGTIWYVEGQLAYLFNPAKRLEKPRPFVLKAISACASGKR